MSTAAAESKKQWIAENLKEGEIYAGLILGLEGQPDYHLVLLPGDAESVNWKNAQAFAAKAGGELPTRREQALLFANLQREFKPRAYWSSEQHASYGDFAWAQFFTFGIQFSNLFKSAELRARAVRRFAI